MYFTLNFYMYGYRYGILIQVHVYYECSVDASTSKDYCTVFANTSIENGF